MAITQVGTATTGSSTDGSSFSVTKPTGVVSGDVLIVAGSSNKGVWDTLPSGFTQVAVSTDGNVTSAFRSYIWYKVCGGSEPASYSFASTTAQGTGAPMVAIISAWRGVDTSASPILTSNVDEGNTYTTNPTTSITTSAVGRVIYAVATRKTGANGSTTITYSTATGGWSELADLDEYSGGTTVYGTAMYAKTADDTAGTFTEPSVTLGGTGGTQDGATYFILAVKTLADPADGTLTSTLPSTTSAFAGTMTEPAGAITALLGIPQTSMSGAATPPDGPIVATLPSVSSTFEGGSNHGDVTSTLPSLTSSFAGGVIHGAITSGLPSITSAWAGGVEPIGGFTATLPFLTGLALTGETRPFGEHVITVEPERRAFRITADDMVPIYRSQVTDQ
jgi:hypothetical protein